MEFGSKVHRILLGGVDEDSPCIDKQKDLGDRDELSFWGKLILLRTTLKR